MSDNMVMVSGLDIWQDIQSHYSKVRKMLGISFQDLQISLNMEMLNWEIES